MIEDKIIKDKIIAITSYCDTTVKLNVLIENIKIIRSRFPDFKIALHANYPLSDEVQKMVDKYFYEDLNYIDDDKWIWYWNIVMNPEETYTYFNRKFLYSILDSGYSVFQQIRALAKYLIDYNWVLLVNYDICAEDIRIEDYSTDYDLTVHHFPDQPAYSLIIMFFNPRIFFEKTAKNFTFENWRDPKRKDQLNEGRLRDIIVESGINHYVHHYLIYDKIKNEPDYHQGPNAPVNDFFRKYLLYFANNILEIYIWDVLTEIKTVTIKIDDDVFVLINQNEKGAFEHMLDYEYEKINNIEIQMINSTNVSIELKLKKGYVVTSVNK